MTLTFIEGRHCVFGASQVKQTCPCWQSPHLRGLRGKPRAGVGGASVSPALGDAVCFMVCFLSGSEERPDVAGLIWAHV